MLLYTNIDNGRCRIIASSIGLMIGGKDKKLVREIQEKIARSNGKYWLYPDRIVFFDEKTNEKTNEQHLQNQKTSFWRKLFGY